MSRRWILPGPLILLVCLSGCGVVAGAGESAARLFAATGANFGVGNLGGVNFGGGGASGVVAGLPNFGIPLQQGTVPDQPGGFAGSGTRP